MTDSILPTVPAAIKRCDWFPEAFRVNDIAGGLIYVASSWGKVGVSSHNESSIYYFEKYRSGLIRRLCGFPVGIAFDCEFL